MSRGGGQTLHNPAHIYGEQWLFFRKFSIFSKVCKKCPNCPKSVSNVPKRVLRVSWGVSECHLVLCMGKGDRRFDGGPLGPENLLKFLSPAAGFISSILLIKICFPDGSLKNLNTYKKTRFWAQTVWKCKHKHSPLPFSLMLERFHFPSRFS